MSTLDSRDSAHPATGRIARKSKTHCGRHHSTAHSQLGQETCAVRAGDIAGEERPANGVDLELPPREPGREPPSS